MTKIKSNLQGMTAGDLKEMLSDVDDEKLIYVETSGTSQRQAKILREDADRVTLIFRSI